MAAKKPSNAPQSEVPAKPDHPDSPTPLGEIEQGPSKLEEFLESNQKLLLIVSLVLVIGVSAWIIIRGLREAKATSAAEAVVAAQDIGDFRNVREQFPSTPAAFTAQLLLAKEQWADGLREEALQTLRDLIQKRPAHPARPSAQMALAGYLLDDGQNEDAVEILKKLANDEAAAHLAPLALVRLGDLERSQGNEDTAREYYSRVTESELKMSPLTEQLAESRLATLGVELPVAVPAPAPPQPQPAKIRPPLLPPDAPDNTATPVSDPIPIPPVPEADPPTPAPVPDPGSPTPLPPNVTIPPDQPDQPPPAPQPEENAPAPAPEPEPAPAPETAPDPGAESAPDQAPQPETP